jgi:hypothetical protein
MDEKMRSDFFADVQKASCTRVGEVLNSYKSKNNLMKLIIRVMDKCDWRRVWKPVKTDRYAYLQVFACMAYHFIKAPELTRDVTNTELIKWVDLDEVVGEHKAEEFSKAAEDTIDMMHKMGGINYAGAKNTSLAFFFVILRKTDPSVIDTIRIRYTTNTKKMNLPIVRGGADQAYRRYKYLVNDYVV